MTISSKFCRHLRLSKPCIGTFAGFVVLVIRRVVNFRYGFLLPCILSLPVTLSLASVGRRHVCHVIIAVLFQSFYIRPLVRIVSTCVLFAINQASIYPTMYHIIYSILGAGFVISRQAIYKAATGHSQRHIALA